MPHTSPPTFWEAANGSADASFVADFGRAITVDYVVLKNEGIADRYML